MEEGTSPQRSAFQSNQLPHRPRDETALNAFNSGLLNQCRRHFSNWTCNCHIWLPNKLALNWHHPYCNHLCASKPLNQPSLLWHLCIALLCNTFIIRIHHSWAYGSAAHALHAFLAPLLLCLLCHTASIISVTFLHAASVIIQFPCHYLVALSSPSCHQWQSMTT